MEPPSGTLTITIDATRELLREREGEVAVPDDPSSLPDVLPAWLERWLVARARRAGCTCDGGPAIVTRVLEDPAWGRYLAPLRVHATACPVSGPRVTIAVVEEQP